MQRIERRRKDLEMNSRDKILAAVARNQPSAVELPDMGLFKTPVADSLTKFTEVLSLVGGKAYRVANYEEIAQIMFSLHGGDKRIVTPIPELTTFYKENIITIYDVHSLYDVEAAIINAHFAVAENGAVWVTEDEMGQRVLPFITQHLAVIINADAIVATMHEAYDRINKITYGFGTFIAGPSKTADIEQSLVIGAHGPRSMTVFIMADNK